MTATWGDLKTQLRRTFLKDTAPDEETGEFKWQDEELLDCLSLALNALAQHTAVASGAEFQGDGQTTVFDLPSNLFTAEPFDLTGTVFVLSESGDKAYLDPIRYTDVLRPDLSNGFYTHELYKLYLSVPNPPASTDKVKILYYAHYTTPTQDSDIVETPTWATAALLYLTAAHALTGFGMRTASIRQWNTKTDSGSPDQNPLRVQQRWFLDMYEREIAKVNPQDRVNHFRQSDL